MVKIYGMNTCPDCTFIKEQIKDRRNEFEYIDIGEDVKNLKAFLNMRDQSPIFDKCKLRGTIGIPCFVKEDGTITLKPEEFGLVRNAHNSCSLEDHKNGVKGC